MKNLIKTILLLSIAPTTLAATTTAYPFSFEVLTEGHPLNVKAKLIQSCRYEKFVLGNSSKFEAKYEKYEIPVKKYKQNSQVVHKVQFKDAVSLSMGGMFKYGKECLSRIELKFESAKYMVGWGVNRSPISFKLESASAYSYQEGETELDLSDFEQRIERNVYSMVFKPIQNVHVNVFFHKNGKKDRTVMGTSAAINPSTNMPFEL